MKSKKERISFTQICIFMAFMIIFTSIYYNIPQTNTYLKASLMSDINNEVTESTDTKKVLRENKDVNKKSIKDVLVTFFDDISEKFLKTID